MAPQEQVKVQGARGKAEQAAAKAEQAAAKAEQAAAKAKQAVNDEKLQQNERLSDLLCQIEERLDIAIRLAML